MELTRLKVNSQYRPCVDEAPYFSWVITSEKNIMQTSYHITVTSLGEVVWDSGVVESDKSTFVEYNGKPFKSLSDYSWTVEVTVNNGEKAAASSSFDGIYEERMDSRVGEISVPDEKGKTRNRRAESGRIFPQRI